MAAESEYEKIAVRGMVEVTDGSYHYAQTAALLFIGEQLERIADAMSEGSPDYSLLGHLRHMLTPGELVVGGTDLANVLDAVEGDDVRLTITRRRGGS